jgi:hypothetical protein
MQTYSFIHSSLQQCVKKIDSGTVWFCLNKPHKKFGYDQIEGLTESVTWQCLGVAHFNLPMSQLCLSGGCHMSICFKCRNMPDIALICRFNYKKCN